MEVPKDLLFTLEHEWIRVEGKNAVIGISQFAQEQLGDIVFVELPEVGSQIEKESPFGVVESVKTVSDLYAPASGKVTKVNKDLETNPEIVNSGPYDAGWIVEIELSDEKDLESLLDPDAYTEQCQKETE
ncbi:MAG: glycine cleavage system protein GcvH [Nitrospina sp.]|jgi:glycine cleavage system H protein|nr:glycine cleavage system protein GcvH [Nitrospina sp.]MBT3415138.1 glycine cleavage system protein GcvH [Nitrospina sp.]MBT3857190.1 glycine cleavage system protein GcvH [Nitrospina sp.]MBT4104215.1 glycine cleavage system protein GcvH [Nitrospina sp.]MBT4388127.1 glycine cleavage system protein GcvH [Nitrospina sp.]